jgi:hypothetical protein
MTILYLISHTQLPLLYFTIDLLVSTQNVSALGPLPPRGQQEDSPRTRDTDMYVDLIRLVMC